MNTITATELVAAINETGKATAQVINDDYDTFDVDFPDGSRRSCQIETFLFQRIGWTEFDVNGEIVAVDGGCEVDESDTLETIAARTVNK